MGIADGAPPVFGPKWREDAWLGFDPEEAIQYELGWKGSARGRPRSSATAALFFISLRVKRQFEFIAPNPSGDGTLIDGID